MPFMILTPIPLEQLNEFLDRFKAGLADPFARVVFDKVRATSPDRAVGAAAERHRQAALALARSLGMAVHPEGFDCAFNWDGTALDSTTEAYVILHEAAHFVLAPTKRRLLVDFGLGPGPDTRDRAAAERAAILSPLAREQEEAAASLLGIIWEAELSQPALASFLDQNWLEGLDRSAPSHFASVLGGLRRRGLLGLRLSAAPGTAKTDGERETAAARTAKPDRRPDRESKATTYGTEPGPRRRCARLASIPSPAGPADNR